MDPGDTNIGGADKRFLTTQWSMILAAGDPAHPDHRDRWETLARTYWKPVYTYIRIAWKKSNEDAKDLAQDFFAYLLRKDYLSKMRPDKGSFRAYLRRALGHFLIDADRHRKARPVILIDVVPDVVEGDDPEKEFDRSWFRVVMEDAVAQLGRELKDVGKDQYFEVFRRYVLPEEKAPTYEALSGELGLTKSDVRNFLAFARAEMQRILRERIRGYVESDEDVEAELREVLRK